MLSYFKIINFRSILDLKLDLAFAEGKAPNGYEESDFLPFVGQEDKYVPILTLLGANASGKTNVLYAFNVFKNILLGGVVNFYFPNELNKKYEATTFEVELDLENEKYIYTIQYNQTGVIFEALYVGDKKHILYEISKTNPVFDKIATKEYTVSRLKEIFKVECQNENALQWLPFISCLAKNYKRLNEKVMKVYAYLFEKVEVYGNNLISLPGAVDKLAKIGTQEATRRAFEKITNLIKKLDFDMNKITFDKKIQPIENQKNFIPRKPTFFKREENMLITVDVQAYHTDVNGNEVVFNFFEESQGTQTVAGLLGIFLSALEEGKVLLIDELDNSLHPYLLKEIVHLFKDKRYNNKNAQLIFTLHNTDFLEDDLIRVSEVGIVNKTLEGGSQLKRIVDFEKIRNVSNFRKQYLQGVFSGIPYPYI